MKSNDALKSAETAMLDLYRTACISGVEVCAAESGNKYGQARRPDEKQL